MMLNNRQGRTNDNHKIFG